MRRYAVLGLWLLAVGCSGPAVHQTVATEPANNLLAKAVWEYSSDDGQTWSTNEPVVHGGEQADFQARTSFQVSDPNEYSFLELTHGLPRQDNYTITLNDRPLPLPIEWAQYETIPAIPADALKQGENQLLVRVSYDNRPPYYTPNRKMRNVTIKLARKLMGLKAEDIGFLSGAQAGPLEADGFAVSCRTRVPLPVKLSLTPAGPGLKPVTVDSPAGLVHRFHAEKLDPAGKWTYSFSIDTSQIQRHTASWPVSFLPPPGDNLRFVAVGDSRTNPKRWGQVASAFAASKPQLVVFSGDMTSNGNLWDRWETEFYVAAGNVTASVPFYGLPGNHEGNERLYRELFFTPGDAKTQSLWRQEINGVLLIGIDGDEDWADDGADYAWLEKTLSESKAKFIFLFSHYPPYSSGEHGEEDEEGQPKERQAAQARQYILPLLGKYHATAMICGHDHNYERNTPPQATVIISGGAGAPIRKPDTSPAAAATQAAQNPYSQVFRAVNHFCLIEVDGDTCRMKAVTPEGEVIDTCSWKARATAASQASKDPRPAEKVLVP